MSQLSPQTGCDAGNLPCYCNNSTNLALLENCVGANCTGGFGGFGGGGGQRGGFFSQFICSSLNSVTTSSSGVVILTTTTSIGGNTQNQILTEINNGNRQSLPATDISSSSRGGSETRRSETVAQGSDTKLATPRTNTANPTSTTTMPTNYVTTPPPFPNQPKPAAAIIGGTIGGISAAVCITALTVHKIRNRRRKRRVLKRLEGLQGGNFIDGDRDNDVNAIVGTGVDETSQSIWSGGPVVSFILDGRRGTTFSEGSRL
ncbi:hypothetical protein H072_6301 [Dactylellina haptotyla CBS 200.50]|uniref:Uncharacterized protein n=1 Tax=Dactylellina haptotyla (strain CBS 200.50) TaxID=1284197 RepID=S8BWS5_DACHA|nr:hypothetical protein H072_6301 [Dactylellina haptotyla CBS 200.50]